MVYKVYIHPGLARVISGLSMEAKAVVTSRNISIEISAPDAIAPIMSFATRDLHSEVVVGSELLTIPEEELKRRVTSLSMDMHKILTEVKRGSVEVEIYKGAKLLDMTGTRMFEYRGAAIWDGGDVKYFHLESPIATTLDELARHSLKVGEGEFVMTLLGYSAEFYLLRDSCAKAAKLLSISDGRAAYQLRRHIRSGRGVTEWLAKQYIEKL